MTPQKVRIVSDGTAGSTRILDARGDPIRWGLTGVVRIEIAPIVPGRLVCATITLEDVMVDIDAVATTAP